MGINDVNEVELKEGFTGKVVLAILFSSFLMTPAFSWVALSTGVGVGGIAAAYVTLVIFGELARILRSPLSENELATIRWGASLAVGGAGGVAWRVFMRKSAITRQFGIADKIPTWWVPPANSPSIVQRTIFHPDWLIPLTIGYFGLPFTLLATISLSFFIRQLYIEVEKLPFPTGAMAAELAKSLAKGADPKKYEIFALTLFFTFLLIGLPYYVLPSIFMIIRGAERPVQLIPTIIDFTRFLDYSPLYGATYGITLDILAISIGMIIPTNVIYGAFIGSIVAYIIGNHYIVSTGLIKWKPGTPIIGPGLTGLWQEPMLKYWMSLSIGFLLAGVFIPFFKSIRSVVSTIKNFFGMSVVEEKRLGVWSGRKSFILFMLSGLMLSILAIALDILYNPNDTFPFWLVPVMIIGISFINSLSIGRSAGLMGSSIEIPYAREILMITFYNGVDAWFNPFLTTIDGGTILIGYKAAELTNTRAMSVVKAQVVDSVVSGLVGLLFSYLFWNIYDVPSRILPAPAWYPRAALQCFFITRQFTFINPQLLVLGLIIGSIIEIYPPLAALLSSIGLSSGFNSIPSATSALFLGWLVKKLIIKRKGVEWTQNYLMSMVAGIWAGGSLAIALGTGLTFAYQAIQPGLI